MKMTKLWALGALLGTLGAITTAQAAPGPAIPLLGGPNSVSAGVFVPSGGDAKVGGNTQFAVEFRYGLPIPLPTATRTVIALGVETGSKNGSHSTVIPVSIGQIASVGYGFYAGGGVGYYFINQHRNSNTLDTLKTTHQAGAYGEVGYSLADTIFVNAKYQFVSHANGLMVTAGLHF